MPQSGLVRALPERVAPPPIVPSFYANKWIPSKYGGTGAASLTAINAALSNAYGYYTATQYPQTHVVDAVNVVVNTANAGAGAVVGLATYDMTRNVRLAYWGTASINTTGEKILLSARPITFRQGSVIGTVAFYQASDTAGTAPALSAFATVTWQPHDVFPWNGGTANSVGYLVGLASWSTGAGVPPPATADWIRAATINDSAVGAPRILYRLHEPTWRRWT